MSGSCTECRWLNVQTFVSENGRTRDFVTCSNAKVKGKPRLDDQTGQYFERVIFCEVERQFESGCGIEGRHFEDRAVSESRKDCAASREIQLENAVITRVEPLTHVQRLELSRNR